MITGLMGWPAFEADSACDDRSGTLRSSVFGFSAQSAEKPNTKKYRSAEGKNANRVTPDD